MFVECSVFLGLKGSPLFRAMDFAYSELLFHVFNNEVADGVVAGFDLERIFGTGYC